MTNSEQTAVPNGQKLKAWIKESGFRREHVVKLIGCDRSRLFRWEKGEICPQPVFRRKIEEITGGYIKAGEWQ